MAEEIEEDVATWDEIKVTTLFTAATSLAFLLVFEWSRRKPSVAAVFDRRRSTKPTRTPPPLLRGSRVFEWVFLSTDPAYVEYTAMVHEEAIIRERRRQRRHLSGATGSDDDDDDDEDKDDGADRQWWSCWFRRPNQSRQVVTERNRSGAVESIIEEEMPQVSYVSF